MAHQTSQPVTGTGGSRALSHRGTLSSYHALLHGIGYTPAEQRRERLRLQAAERFARGDGISEIARDLRLGTSAPGRVGMIFDGKGPPTLDVPRVSLADAVCAMIRVTADNPGDVLDRLRRDRDR